MNHIEAAARLGLPVSEIRDVNDSPAGDIVVTTDGVAYIVVPEDNPDSEGKTGLMYLSAPHDRYGDTFPVYAAPVDDDEVERDSGVLSKADLIARAKELGIDANGKWGEKKLLAAIADAEAGGTGNPAGSDPDPAAAEREALVAEALELGIDNADELSDEELVEAVEIARGG